MPGTPQRAEEIRQERQRLLARQERKRQELAFCDAAVLEETRITENLKNLGQTLKNLSAPEQKELVGLFVERVEVRRTPGKQTDPIGGPASRVLEIKVKLHLPELLRNADHSLTSLQVSAGRLGRGLSVGARVDFTHAPRGEISLIAPFQRSVRLDARVRTVPPSKRAIVHPIVRALKWQQMLDEKVVPHRFALAAKMGVTPGAVTKVLRLTKLLPEIQSYLASLKSRPELWHFSLTRMGSLAALPAELQRSAFDKMKDRFTQAHPESLLLPAVSVQTVNVKGRNSPRLSAG